MLTVEAVFTLFLHSEITWIYSNSIGTATELTQSLVVVQSYISATTVGIREGFPSSTLDQQENWHLPIYYPRTLEKRAFALLLSRPRGKLVYNHPKDIKEKCYVINIRLILGSD